MSGLAIDQFPVLFSLAVKINREAREERSGTNNVGKGIRPEKAPQRNVTGCCLPIA